MLELAAVCWHAGVSVATANRALVAAYPWPEDGPWAAEVEVDDKVYAVGQGGNPLAFYCLPCPFPGDPAVSLPPFDSTERFLVFLGGPRKSDLVSA